jgi:hypothetical protein
MDPSLLVIDQITFASKVTQTPLLKLTVRGSCLALTALSSEIPQMASWNADLQPYFPQQQQHQQQHHQQHQSRWRRVWTWVWASHRDRKVCDFLWRLLHRSLNLGFDRRRYSQDSDSCSCCVCPDQIESYSHLLIDCPISHHVWRWFILVWHTATDLHLDDTLFGCLFSSLVPSKVPAASKHRWLILSVAHGELLYSLWLCRCRAIFDQQPNEFSIWAITSTATFRINRALQTVCSAKKWKSDALSRLSACLSDAMKDPRLIRESAPRP